jgi:hypothetical protein
MLNSVPPVTSVVVSHDRDLAFGIEQEHGLGAQCGCS